MDSSQKINILIIPADYYPSNTGFANASLNLVKSMHEYQPKYVVHVFATTKLAKCVESPYGQVIRYAEATTRYRLSRLVSIYKKYKFIDNYVKQNDISLILFETNTFSILQNLLLAKHKEKISVRIHSTADTEVLMYYPEKTIFSRIVRYYDLKFMKDIKYVISTNSFHKSFIKQKMYNDNVFTIWDEKEYYILPNTFEKSQNILKIVRNERSLLTMGKLSHNGYVQKGMKDLVKAIYILETNNEVPKNLEIVLIGDGPMREDIIEYANKMRVQQYFKFVRATTHEESLGMIAQASAIILLSRYEGQSMFITEALGMSKALIITQNNGMKDMIVHEKNGFVVEEGEFLDAATYIKRLFSLTEEQISSMESYSGQIFESKFSPERVSELFSNIIDMIVASSNK